MQVDEGFNSGDDSEALFLNTLRMVAPGTLLNESLENIIRARTGALIVIGDGPDVIKITSGGFRLDCELTAARLYELAKMDGAIILDDEAKRIVLANVQLLPDPTIPSDETGSRHRTAERVAKQTHSTVLAVSQRRNVVTLYRNAIKYVLRDVGLTLAKANQAIQTLQEFRTILDKSLARLTILEFENAVTLGDPIWAVQRREMLRRVEAEIEHYVAELGVEGRLIEMQLQELVFDVENEGTNLVRDYMLPSDNRTIDSVKKQLKRLSFDELVDQVLIARALGFSTHMNLLEQPVCPRGYRILSKIPKIPSFVVDNIVETFGNLPAILNSSVEELDKVEGVGESRARTIKEGLKRLRESAMIERRP